MDEEGRQWKKTTTRLSIFNLDSPFGKKRPFDKIGAGPGSTPSRKRTKRQCNLGPNCPFLWSAKGCRKYHPPKEFRAAQKGRRKGQKPDSRADLKGPSRGGARGKSQEPCKNFAAGRPCIMTPCPYSHEKKVRFRGEESNRPKRKPKCRRGVGCTFWQSGNCWNGHDAREMTCASCGNKGHGSSRCRSKGGSQYGRCDPASNPVHKGPEKHVQLLNEKKMTALISDAMKPLSDTVVATVRQQVEEMRDDIAKNAMGMKASRSHSGKSPGEAAYTAFSRIFDPKTGVIHKHLRN